MTINGYIDLHTHGIGRYDTKTERPADILKIADLHGDAGTGGIVLTIYPGPLDAMRKNMEAVRQAMEMQERSSSGPQSAAIILGMHLEGPFLNPSKCGALDSSVFAHPSLSYLKKLLSGYEDLIRIITIAPELPGALRVIEKCASLGIKVNMGHSDATYDQGVAGKKAGATGITHMFNAMRQFHHREPGLAGLGLIDEDLYLEVIADGFHLHPRTLELIFNRKRLDRIILVSDSVKSGRKSGLPVYSKSGILAGSGVMISGAVGVLKDLGIPDAEITEAAVDNPARYIGLKNVENRI